MTPYVGPEISEGDDSTGGDVQRAGRLRAWPFAPVSELFEVRRGRADLLCKGAPSGGSEAAEVFLDGHITYYYQKGNSAASVLDIPGAVINPHHREMTIEDVRRANLAALVRDRAEGNQSTFGVLVSKSASQINQYLHSKAMGGRMARELEDILKLSPGWMDKDHVGAAESSRSVWGFSISREAATLAAEWDKIESAGYKQAFKTLIIGFVAKQMRDTRETARESKNKVPDDNLRR